MKKMHSTGVAAHIGRYSDAAEVSGTPRWLYTSGTPGIRPDGTVPETIEEQSEQAWKNVLAILGSAGMGIEDIVKVSQYLIRREDVAPYVQIRSRFLSDMRPAFMLTVVTELVRPEFLVEVEIYAAKS